MKSTLNIVRKVALKPTRNQSLEELWVRNLKRNVAVELCIKIFD